MSAGAALGLSSGSRGSGCPNPYDPDHKLARSPRDPARKNPGSLRQSSPTYLADHGPARLPRDAAREAHDPCNCRHRVRGISEIPPAIPAIPTTNLHDPLAIPHAKPTIPVTVVTHCPLL